MKIIKILSVALAMLILGQPALAGEEAADAGPTLYERMGSWDGVDKIVGDTIALHLENDDIAHFFADVDVEKLQSHVTAFFAAGTGGPNKYEGRDMVTTHTGMNMSDADFDAAVSDVLKAVRKNVEEEAVAEEVNAILQSLRPAVMGTAAPAG
jgi:truncated hemoglobin YjbI